MNPVFGKISACGEIQKFDRNSLRLGLLDFETTSYLSLKKWIIRLKF